MTTGETVNPYLDARFVVELEGLAVAGFSEVQGLEIEVETEEYEEGGVNHYTHVLPKRVTHPNLTLRQGMTDSEDLWSWVRESIHGTAQRKTGRIILLDSAGHEVRGWEFIEAYPVRWEGPEFSADKAEVAIETLEISHHGLKKHDTG